MLSLSLSLLGHLAVSWDKRPLTTFRSNRIPALMVYLTVEADRPHRRETLMELLWPGLPAVSARQNLRQTLYLLRQEIPELTAKTGEGTVPLVLSDRHTIQVNPNGDFFLDVTQLEQLVSGSPTADQLTEAIALYRGDFLADFYLPDSENFEEWAASRRAAYRRLVLDALTKLTAVHLEQDNFAEAEKYARQQLEVDNLRESGHRQLMEVLARNGRRRAALSHYEGFSQLLQTELSIEPSVETQALAKAIRTGELSAKIVGRGKKSEAREEKGEERSSLTSPLVLRPLSAPPHSLPAQATPFIGREAELAALGAFIADPQVRLMTIVGVGGMGKTRLALACAERHLTADSSFPHGVFFVNLAPLSEVEHLIPALAGTLNFPLQGGDGHSPHEQLLDYLRQKKMLLLFDNFEHLLDGVDLLTDILQAAPEVQILVTSRERLHLRMEQVYPIEGLEFPDWETASPLGEEEDAGEYTAVQLFLQSAHRNQPDFALRNDNDLAYLARICHTVAGMPLALELAASWVDMLPLAEIATELQQGLDLLETDMQDMPERHRSVRAAIDYSWQKLAEPERDIFAKLSVFRGGFTREAAQAVAGANLRPLARLVTKSLLQVESGNGRYQIHELLRQYGAEKLQESGQKTVVRQKHSHFYCRALQQWEAELKSVRQQTAVTQMEADYQNILMAWDEALLQGKLTQLVQAVNGLGGFYDVANHWSEGTALMQKSTETVQADFGDAPTTAVQVQLLVWLRAWQVNLNLMLISFFGQWEEHPVLVEYLQSNQRLLAQSSLSGADVRAEKAFVAMLLGNILLELDAEKGKEHLVASLHLYQSLGDNFHVAQVIEAQGTYLYFSEDKPEQAYVLLHECLSMFRQIGEPRRIVETLSKLANVARALLKFSEIAVFADEAYTIAQAAMDHQGMHQARKIVADLAWYQGQFDLALAYQKEALDWAKRTNSSDIIGSCLGAIALTQLYRGRVAEALLLYQESKEMSSIYAVMEPFFYLHAGHYEKAESLFTMKVITRGLRFLAWAKVAQANYAAALSVAYEGHYEELPGNHEHRAWAQIPLAFALHRLGQTSEAKQELYQCLQTCVQIQGFLPLMQLIPILAVVLAESNNERSKERAIELYALAESLPFVSNSQLFADLAGKPLAAIAASLPSSVVKAAKARGRELDWWPTAESLLGELGWKAEKQRSRRAEEQGRFVKGELLAVGGFGEVYQGRDRETGQVIVVKRLKPELVAQQPEAVTRFVREGELLRQLNHPNIVKMIATEEIQFSEEVGGEQCLIMEYVAGGSLRDLLDKEGKLSVARTLDIALELADALSRAHHLNIIHRDLKPGNVLLAEDGTPRLTDFGIARVTQQEGIHLTQAGSMVGTVHYMSPEACRGEELDGRADIWSFGVLLYEMLTGERPFSGEQVTATIIAILNNPTPDLQALRPDVLAALVRLIERMLVKEREGRMSLGDAAPGRMRQVAAELDKIRNSLRL